MADSFLAKAQSMSVAETRRILLLLEAIKQVNATQNLDTAIQVIVEQTCRILECDRATVFMVDPITENLVIKQAVGCNDITIPKGVGIAGLVYTSGETLNIPDAYEDDRFSQATDQRTGYKTTSILCTPIRDAAGTIVAVLQAINKQASGEESLVAAMAEAVVATEGGSGDGESAPLASVPFVAEDAELLGHLSAQVGVILRNCVLFEASVVEQGRVRAMLDIVRSMHGGMGINSLMFTITERTPQLVNADRCTLYLVDATRGELWSMHGAVEIRIPMDVGIAGSVASTGQTENIADAYLDARFDQSFDKSTGYRTKSILCMPIRGSSGGDVIGVIQLINKLDGGAFSDDGDASMLASFLDIVGNTMTASQMFAKQAKRQEEKEVNEFQRMTASPRPKSDSVSSMGGMMMGAVIEEGDEEEEEEEEEEGEEE